MRTVTKLFFDYLLRGSGNFQGSKNGQSFLRCYQIVRRSGCGFWSFKTSSLIFLPYGKYSSREDVLLLYRLSRLLKLNKLTFMTFYVLYNLQHNQKHGYILQINTQKRVEILSKLKSSLFFWEPTFTLYKNGNWVDIGNWIRKSGETN